MRVSAFSSLAQRIHSPVARTDCSCVEGLESAFGISDETAVGGTDPEIALGIHPQTRHTQTLEGHLIADGSRPERDPVEASQPAVRADPQEAFGSLGQRGDRCLRQPFRLPPVSEQRGSGMRTGSGESS